METNKNDVNETPPTNINEKKQETDLQQDEKSRREEMQKQDPALKKEEVSPLEKQLGYQPDSSKHSNDVEAELKARMESEKEEKEEE